MDYISCAECGEHWNAYGARNGDMSVVSVGKFLAGEGCPSCNWGKYCPSCEGSGRLICCDSVRCTVCHDYGYCRAWVAVSHSRGFSVGEMYIGRGSRVRHLPNGHTEITVGEVNLPEKLEDFLVNAGLEEEWLAACPEGCAEDTDFTKCLRCSGTGSLVPAENLRGLECGGE